MKNWDKEPMIQTYTGSLYGAVELSKELKNAHATGDWKKFICHQRMLKI